MTKNLCIFLFGVGIASVSGCSEKVDAKVSPGAVEKLKTPQAAPEEARDVVSAEAENEAQIEEIQVEQTQTIECVDEIYKELNKRGYRLKKPDRRKKNVRERKERRKQRRKARRERRKRTETRLTQQN